MDYEEFYLRDLCSINSESYSPSENWNFVNYLDTGNITENKIDEIQFFDLNEDKLPSRAKRKVKINDIVYSTVRPNQRHFGIIQDEIENFLVSTGFSTIRAFPDKLNSDYLYYYLSQEHIINYLHSIAEQSVSAYPSIKPSDIGNLKINIPPIEIQEKIAHILNHFEYLVKINEKINKNLYN